MKICNPIHSCGSIGFAVILFAINVAIIMAACGCTSTPEQTIEDRHRQWEGIDTTVIGVPITNRTATCVRFNHPDGSTTFRSRVKGTTDKWMTTTVPARKVHKVKTAL